MPEELSPSAAAARLGATTRSVQRWISLGRLPARRVGGRWRVASDALDAFAVRGVVEMLERHPSRPLFSTLYVANRGEIVRRISRTAQRLGIAMATPATGPDAELDLLDIGAVVEAALQANADALHPGFGFLAENPDFAQTVLDAGIRWVGPPPAAIRAMGDKGAARRLAVELGIPVAPGYDGADQSIQAIEGAAASIGYPILVKPSGGGGGKGMRVVRTADQLVDAVAGARREAAAAFGDDRVILERLVEGPRHVEVQVLFDAAGHGVHLGERDCSLQRRHQKVLEESPSPAVTPAIRARLTEAALALAAAVGYESAGTCEFLVGDRGELSFLEMNTRLQVEHPVTELVTGVDLVEQQLRIAAGETLPLDQVSLDRARERGGHAIEVRLYAEDAEAGFLPATGRVERLVWPQGEGIRIDAGIDEGTEVGGRFDPLLAKIIAHGRGRSEAFERLAAALDDTVVLGLTTNLRLLRWLVGEPVVRAGEARIDTLDRIWPPDDWSDRTGVPDDAWQAAARALTAGTSQDGWRLNATRQVRLSADDVDRSIRIEDQIAAPGTTSPKFIRVGDLVHVDVAGRSVPIGFALPPDVDRAARAAAGSHAGGPAELVAPMPGAVLTVHREVGHRVEAGDAIVTLEAMKMEHAVLAPVAGLVAELSIRAGDQVTRGQVLAVLEP